jgi:hypothetical protein
MYHHLVQLNLEEGLASANTPGVLHIRFDGSCYPFEPPLLAYQDGRLPPANRWAISCYLMQEAQQLVDAGEPFLYALLLLLEEDQANALAGDGTVQLPQGLLELVNEPFQTDTPKPMASKPKNKNDARTNATTASSTQEAATTLPTSAPAHTPTKRSNRRGDKERAARQQASRKQNSVQHVTATKEKDKPTQQPARKRQQDAFLKKPTLTESQAAQRSQDLLSR